MMQAGPLSFFRASSFSAPVSATGVEGTFGGDGDNATARGVSGDLFGGNAGDEVIEGSWDDLIICTPTGGFHGGLHGGLHGGIHGQMGWGGERTSRGGRRTQLWEGDPQLVYRLQQSYHAEDTAVADPKADPTVLITGAESTPVRDDGEEEDLHAGTREAREAREAATPPGMVPETRDIAETARAGDNIAGAQLPLQVKVEFPTPSPRGGLTSPSSRGGLGSPSRGGLGFSYHSPIPLCSPSPLRLCAMELGDMAEPNLWLSPPASTKYTLEKLGDFPPFSPRLPAIMRGYSAGLPYLDPSAHQQAVRMSPSRGAPSGFAPPQAPGGPSADATESPPAPSADSAVPQSGLPADERAAAATRKTSDDREPTNDGETRGRADDAPDQVGARREGGAAELARMVSAPGSGVRYVGMRGRSLLQQCLIMGAEQRAIRATAGGGGSGDGGGSADVAGGAAASERGPGVSGGGGGAAAPDRTVEGNENDERGEEDENGERGEKTAKTGDAEGRAAGVSPSVLKWRAADTNDRDLCPDHRGWHLTRIRLPRTPLPCVQPDRISLGNCPVILVLRAAAMCKRATWAVIRG
ncbi:hypothetical protein CLOM_g6818 [Closterium sp. NIES-68]|nr:hypothetical protein CLOM_g6818 [Closterium sp. NIES-68]